MNTDLNIDERLHGYKTALISLGCDKNLLDSEVMLGLVKEAGSELTNNLAEADVIIVNTCGFILDASQESVDRIIDAGEFKNEGTGVCKAVIVTGCLAQRYQEDIFDEMPEVDAIIGTGDYDQIVDVIADILSDDGERVQTTAISSANNDIEDEILMKRIQSTPKHYAYMKIAEGCDNRCTYCAIPDIRGSFRSRSMESLMEEAEMLAKNGVKELILVAQDTSLYGKDLYGEQKLHELLANLSKIEGLEWIRILYCYPEHINGYDALLKEMSENSKILHYIDMPIQHASDKILTLMGRKSTNEQLTKVISDLRKAMPDVVIRTTLITGFPGETEEDFKILTQFVEDTRFDRLGVFAYSREEGTPADKLKGHLNENIKEKRKNKIMEIQSKISTEKCKEFVGKSIDVLVDGFVESEGVYCGRAYSDAPNIDGLVFFKKNTNADTKIEAGNIIKVKITESSNYDLIGEI